METLYGLPVVTAENIFSILKELSIQKWPHIQPSTMLDDYLLGKLTDKQRMEVKRFAPKAEVVFLQDPKGRSYTGFRSVGKNWATVFILIEGDLLPIVAEYEHGAEVISLVPPSGIPGRKEADLTDSLSACARREVREETGINLTELILLSDPEGIPISTRQSTMRYFPYLGIPQMPITPHGKRLDPTEFLQTLLIPLKEWLKLIKTGKVAEDCAISVTFLALQKLGRIKMIKI